MSGGRGSRQRVSELTLAATPVSFAVDARWEARLRKSGEASGEATRQRGLWHRLHLSPEHHRWQPK